MVKYFFTAMLCAFVTTTSIAQTDNAAKYAATITTEDLKKHLTIVADGDMEGRETGTEGQRKASLYIQEQFKAIGLKPAEALKGYEQFFPLYKDSMISSVLKIGKEKLQFGSDYYTLVNLNTSKKISAKKIVFAGYGISEKNYDDYKGKNVKGKIVVFLSGEPRNGETYLVTGNN